MTAASNDTTLVDALPGLRMPVTEVTEALSSMWAAPMPGEGRPPEDFRASQLNLVLHFGLRTAGEDAKRCFETAIAFAKTNPCRIIVLCPMGHQRDDRLLDAKLYAECFVGDGLREMCCCEALILGYPTREAGFLTNQVSMWLEGDLPIYLWTHLVPAERLRENHADFIQMCRRVVFDDSIEGGALSAADFPEPSRVVDLAAARLLPVRQSLGQYLSSFTPSTLVEGLKHLEILAAPQFLAEARALAAWVEKRLRACASTCGQTWNASATLAETDAAWLAMRWTYDQAGKGLQWTLRCDGDGCVEVSFGDQEQTPLPARLLSPVNTLSEALFFT